MERCRDGVMSGDGKNRLLCDYEAGHPGGHSTSLMAGGLVDYMARAMRAAAYREAAEYLESVGQPGGALRERAAKIEEGA